jgi:hypothetical protein
MLAEKIIGVWELRIWETVVDDINVCSFENWVGTDQHRQAELDLTKGTLILSTAPVLTQGRMGGNRLTWKRITSTG